MTNPVQDIRINTRKQGSFDGCRCCERSRLRMTGTQTGSSVSCHSKNESDQNNTSDMII